MTLSSALEHEQLRCGYVSGQTKLAAPHLAFDPKSNTHSSGLTLSSLEKGQAGSSLAATLVSVFEGLSAYGMAHTMVNDWIDLPLATYDPRRPVPTGAQVEKLRPYHTLLLKDSEEEMRQCLGGDCSPALLKLIKHVDPRLSLQELQQRIDIPLEQMYCLAAHLVYWGKAKVMAYIQRNSMYVVNPRCDLRTTGEMTKNFNRKFPRVNLASILQHFAEPRRLGDKLDMVKSQQKKQELMGWVVWLLKHDALIPLHNYILFLPPRQNGLPEGACYPRDRVLRTTSEEDLLAHEAGLGSSPGSHSHLPHSASSQSLPKSISNTSLATRSSPSPSGSTQAQHLAAPHESRERKNVSGWCGRREGPQQGRLLLCRVGLSKCCNPHPVSSRRICSRKQGPPRRGRTHRTTREKASAGKLRPTRPATQTPLHKSQGWGRLFREALPRMRHGGGPRKVPTAGKRGQ